MKESEKMLLLINNAKKEKSTTAEKSYISYIAREENDRDKKQEKILLDDYLEEDQKNQDIQLYMLACYNNYKNYLLYENIDLICNIWNKYDGRQAGKKTLEKIYNEIKKACPAIYYIDIDYRNININNEKYYTNNDIINENNTILKTAFDGWSPCKGCNIIHDIEKYVKVIKEEYKKIRKARREYNNIVKIYNESLVEGLEDIDQIYKSLNFFKNTY